MIDRTDKKEILDSPDVLPEKVMAAHRALAWQNKVTLHNMLLIHYIKFFIVSGQAISVLDVGAGDGAFCFVLSAWAQKRRVPIQITALEPNPLLAQQIRVNNKYDNLLVVEGELDLLTKQYDVVLCAQVLHHIEPDELPKFIGQMYNSSLRGVIISDLIRSRLYFYFTKAILFLLTSDSISRHDGPISILRSHSKQELWSVFNKLGINKVKFHDFFPRRIIVIRK